MTLSEGLSSYLIGVIGVDSLFQALQCRASGIDALVLYCGYYCTLNFDSKVRHR